MSVEIKIYGEFAGDALAQLRELAGGLTGTTSAAPGVTREEVARPTPAPVTHAAETPATETPKPAAKKSAKKDPAPAPQIQEPTAEDQAMDAADEAAEEQTQVEERAYTADDVRAAGAAYVKKFGAESAQKDCAAIYAEVGHVGKISDCKDAEKLKQIATGILAAIETNRFKREAVS